MTRGHGGNHFNCLRECRKSEGKFYTHFIYLTCTHMLENARGTSYMYTTFLCSTDFCCYSLLLLCTGEKSLHTQSLFPPSIELTLIKTYKVTQPSELMPGKVFNHLDIYPHRLATVHWALGNVSTASKPVLRWTLSKVVNKFLHLQNLSQLGLPNEIWSVINMA